MKSFRYLSTVKLYFILYMFHCNKIIYLMKASISSYYRITSRLILIYNLLRLILCCMVHNSVIRFLFILIPQSFGVLTFQGYELSFWGAIYSS